MRLPRWLFIPVILVAILYWSQDVWKGCAEPSLFDVPKTLEEETYTLELYPVSDVNEVAVWSTSVGVNHNDHLYLTPADDLPMDYKEKIDSGYIARVSGRYFKGSGIPVEYLHITPKPERLRVFLFESIEMVKPSVRL